MKSHGGTNGSKAIYLPLNLPILLQSFLIFCVRKHLYKDLRPYVCTFMDCDLRLFENSRSWFEHELQCHRFEWPCRFCSHLAFDSASKLSAHMRHHHVQLSTPSQLSALIKVSKQPVDKIAATDCPLCDWNAILRGINIDTSQDETLVVTLEQFRRHLGAHMEQLAFFALPRSLGDDEKNATSNEAAAITNSGSQSRKFLGEESFSWKTTSCHEASLKGHDNVVQMSLDQYSRWTKRQRTAC